MALVYQITSYLEKDISFALWKMLDSEFNTNDWASLYQNKSAEYLYNAQKIKSASYSPAAKNIQQNIDHFNLSQYYNKTLDSNHFIINERLNEIFPSTNATSFNNIINNNIPKMLVKYIKKGYTIEFNYIKRINFTERFIESEQQEEPTKPYSLLLFLTSSVNFEDKAQSYIFFPNQPMKQVIQSGDLFIIPNTEDFNYTINTNNIFESIFVVTGKVSINETRFCVKNITISIPLVQEIENGAILYKNGSFKLNKGEGMNGAYQKIMQASQEIIMSMADFEKEFGHLFA
jgi:hypothetical protein